MTLFKYLFRQIKLSYGITVCNEARELDDLLQFILTEKDARDEVIVLQDVTVKDKEVTAILAKYGPRITVKEAYLNGDFAAFKNNFLGLATGDFLFQIDADEMPHRTLLKKMKRMLRRKYKYDCFLVPRINRVDGISASDIEKWNWRIDDLERINFPDYQTRIFSLKGAIKWRNKVHEELIQWKRQYHFPSENDDFCLLHTKSIARQTRQNEFYKKLS